MEQDWLSPYSFYFFINVTSGYGITCGGSLELQGHLLAKTFPFYPAPNSLAKKGVWPTRFESQLSSAGASVSTVCAMHPEVGEKAITEVLQHRFLNFNGDLHPSQSLQGWGEGQEHFAKVLLKAPGKDCMGLLGLESLNRGLECWNRASPENNNSNIRY